MFLLLGVLIFLLGHSKLKLMFYLMFCIIRKVNLKQWCPHCLRSWPKWFSPQRLFKWNNCQTKFFGNFLYKVNDHNFHFSQHLTSIRLSDCWDLSIFMSWEIKSTYLLTSSVLSYGIISYWGIGRSMQQG